MKERRAKLIAGATVLGLGALGGAAMSTNHGLPATRQLAASGSSSIATGASSTAATQATGTTATARPPIVTRASGGAAPVEIDE